VGYQKDVNSIGRHALVAALTVPWPAAEPFYPADIYTVHTFTSQYSHHQHQQPNLC